MSEYISIKMGVKFVESLNTGKNLCCVLNIITYKNVKNKLPFTLTISNEQKMRYCQ